MIQNYHLVSLKFLANIYQTSQGKQVMQDLERGTDLIEFCAKSFSSCNDKVIYHAALVLFNHMLCFDQDNKKPLLVPIQVAWKAIDLALASLDMVD